MVDLVQQLREVKSKDFHPDSLRTMVLWGADEIERLYAENRGLSSQMTTAQYLKALTTLGLKPQSKAAAAALGISVRQCQRYANGDTIPETIALLLKALVELDLLEYVMNPGRK